MNLSFVRLYETLHECVPVSMIVWYELPKAYHDSSIELLGYSICLSVVQRRGEMVDSEIATCGC